MSRRTGTPAEMRLSRALRRDTSCCYCYVASRMSVDMSADASTDTRVLRSPDIRAATVFAALSEQPHGRDSVISAENDPVVSGLQLRRNLRNARDDARLSQDRVAKQLRWSGKKIYRIESGESAVAIEDVAALARIYGLDPERTRELQALAEATYGPAWWEHYRAVVSPEFGLYLSCERAATELSYFHPTLVHGLVQSEDYAQAMLAGVRGGAELSQVVRLRRERREVFNRAQPPRVMILLGEAALHDQVGGAETMRSQLVELRRIATAGDGDMVLGVVPFENCVYPPMLIGFDLIRLPDGSISLYQELPPSSRTTKDETVLNELYADFFAQIRARAVFGSDAAALIDAILEKRTRGDCEQ